MEDKKLCKSRENRMLCGVCVGIAKFLNIDPSIIRVLWIIFACAAGSGILAYLLVAIVLPEEK